MSDTYRRYRAIKQGILQCYTPRPTGHQEKHFNTLVALICGLVGAKQAHLPAIADQAPSGGATQESLIRRFSRFVKNDRHTIKGWFLPVAKALLKTLASQPIHLVMDGSVVGRGCLALMLSVVYHGRALPLCWVVVSAPKGHFPQATHRELLAQVREMMPSDAQVTFLGDGEFDGTDLQADLTAAGWHYTCRTASNILMCAYDVHFQVADLQPERGQLLAITPAWMTANAYGPVSLLGIWELPYQEPIYLVTNMDDLDMAVRLYKQRPKIETFFSEQKSRGFNIHKSHLSDPKRLCRLLIASCLAYLWIAFFGYLCLAGRLDAKASSSGSLRSESVSIGVAAVGTLSQRSCPNSERLSGYADRTQAAHSSVPETRIVAQVFCTVVKPVAATVPAIGMPTRDIG